MGVLATERYMLDLLHKRYGHASPGELPDGWGLLVMHGMYEQKLIAKIQPIPVDNGPLSPTATAALLRATVKTAVRNLDATREKEAT